jgi:cytochrome c2
MKSIIIGLLAISSIAAHAADSASVVAAIQVAKSVKDITGVSELSRERCIGCYLIEVSGEGQFGPAWSRVRTSRTGQGEVHAEVVEVSR